MELDELKLLLNQKIDDSRGLKTPLDIAILLKKKTQSIIHKLKKSLWIEIIFSLVIFLLFGYIGLFSKYTSLQIYFSVFTILCVVFMLVLLYLLQKINKLSNTNMPIKQNLISIHSIIKEFTKRYLQFTLSLIPICLLFSGYLGYQDAKNGVVIDELDTISNKLTSPTKLIVFLVAYLLALSVGVYYFTKWYLKKLYGKYLIQLQDCINELD